MPTLALVLKEVASSAHGTRIVDGLRQLGMTIKVVGKLSCSVLLTNREEQSKAAFLIVGTAKGASFLEDAERLARVFPAHAAIPAVREDEAMAKLMLDLRRMALEEALEDGIKSGDV